MDVKVGNGAFMPDYEASRKLARSIAEVATGAGTPTTALLTDMNQCLANSAGNAVEVREAVEFLTGGPRNPRLESVTLALCTEALQTSGLASSAEDAHARLQQALSSGRAAERFAKMVTALGGPADFVENHRSYLPTAAVARHVMAGREGTVLAIDTRALGMCVVHLGGGRTNPSQDFDHGVGLTRVAALGQQISRHTPLAVVHARGEAAAARASAEIRAAYTLGDKAFVPKPEIYERIVPEGI